MSTVERACDPPRDCPLCPRLAKFRNANRAAHADYFNDPADNGVYNRGPIINLIDSTSYPSGHTTYGYMGALVLAILVPDRYQQMITRAPNTGMIGL